MKTELELGTLMNSSQSLAKLSQCDMPLNVGFRISVFLEETQKILNKGFEKQDQLAKKYEGKLGTKKAIEELQKLHAEKINLEIPKVTITELGDISLSPSDIIILKWLIKK